MELSRLQKIGGISLIIGSMLLSAYSICFYTLLPLSEIHNDITVPVLSGNWVWIAMVAFLGIILMLFGFTAVYSKVYEESGSLGFWGYLFVEIAYILQACKVTWEIFIYPLIAENPLSAHLLKDAVLQHSPLVVAYGAIASATIFIGITLFCITLVRAKAFPPLAGMLIFLGALLYGLGPKISVTTAIGGILILSAGCFLLGVSLSNNA